MEREVGGHDKDGVSLSRSWKRPKTHMQNGRCGMTNRRSPCASGRDDWRYRPPELVHHDAITLCSTISSSYVAVHSAVVGLRPRSESDVAH